LQECNAKPLFLSPKVAEGAPVWFNTPNFPQTEVGSGFKPELPSKPWRTLK
jgi:hypothetical protein